MAATTAQRLLAGVTGLTDDLTPGQRWTASLATGLAVLVLAFGLPEGVRTVVQSPVATTTDAPSLDDTASLLVEMPPVTTATPATVARPLPSPTPSVAVADPATSTSTTTPTTAPAAMLQVAALVVDGPDAGRSDTAMVTHFADDAGLLIRTVEVDPAAPSAACSSTSGADLVIAGGAVPAAVRSCVVDRGGVTLGFDDDLPLATSASLSTRRGAARSLVDTASRIGREIESPVVLVADERLRDSLVPALEEARGRGLPVDDVVWLADDGDPPPGTALGFAGSGVNTMLFATSTSRQTSLASQISLVEPGVAYVVLDAEDSVFAGGYPLLFDGARAVTATQFPWNDGDAATREACRSSWESRPGGAVVADDAELLRVLTWCQHVALAARAMGAPEGSVLAALQAARLRSPITSPIALVGDLFGPTALTTANWSSTCSCWASDEPFTPEDTE